MLFYKKPQDNSLLVISCIGVEEKSKIVLWRAGKHHWPAQHSPARQASPSFRLRLRLRLSSGQVC